MLQLETFHLKLEGEEKEAKRRRNAMINSLIAKSPGIDQGKRTVAGVVRDCLFSIAPVYLWQYFSSQGKSGTKKGNLARDLPQIYRVVMGAVISITKADNSAVISAIGTVIRACPNRAESKKFLKCRQEEDKTTDESISRDDVRERTTEVENCDEPSAVSSASSSPDILNSGESD